MALTIQLCQRLDLGFRQFRRDGDVRQQRRLRQRGLLVGRRLQRHRDQLRRRDEQHQLDHAQPRARDQLVRRHAAGSAVLRHRRRRGRTRTSRLIQPINGGSSTNYCTLIKNRGIKIAILYTEYLPVPANSFYNDYVAPIQSDLGPALQACASPDLFYDAKIGDDLGAALATLFQAVVQSASLSQ